MDSQLNRVFAYIIPVPVKRPNNRSSCLSLLGVSRFSNCKLFRRTLPSYIVASGICSCSAKSFLTRLVADAVNAKTGISGNRSRSRCTFRYEGRKSKPHCEMQCASSIAIKLISAFCRYSKNNKFESLSGA